MKVKDNSNVVLVLIIISIVLVSIIALIINRYQNRPVSLEGMTEEEMAAAAQEIRNDVNLARLRNATERERIEDYVNQFLKCIENEDYSSAYDMLYDEFKENYFPTEEEFEGYVSKRFPSMMSKTIKNIERNDDIYVLWVEIKNPIEVGDTTREVNFVVRENGLNDFDLSFQVNKL